MSKLLFHKFLIHELIFISLKNIIKIQNLDFQYKHRSMKMSTLFHKVHILSKNKLQIELQYQFHTLDFINKK